jgi:subtilisin family serine protease
VSPLRRIAPVLMLLLVPALLAAGGATARPTATAPMTEVVVTLPQPPLSLAVSQDRELAAAATTHHGLDLRAPAAVSYLRTIATAQRRLQSRIAAVIPSATARWHYGVVLNGVAVVVPTSQLPRLRALRGVTVWPSMTYHSLLDRTPKLIGAPTVWGPTLATAGQGVKIGIIDDGLDQTHVFFDPSGFSYPAGFPKGNTSYTTAKVIVARAFAPAQPKWKYAGTPFDPLNSDHATNVAGIAAGDHDTVATVGGKTYHVSGIAPMAYLGNYKVLTIPTASFGLDGNSPEIVAGIEQAVKDGMDVINLSLGEPEIDPSRDIVVKAIDDAAAAGVVPVIAAGNDFDEAGRGSIGSPGNAPDAISVAASTEGENGPADEIASFSSSGPTPVSLLMKPDVTAPGVDILSSLPRRDGTWSDHDWSGTSMATPHVAGAAAVLHQRHPTWTVPQIRSALESTGDPVHTSGTTNEVLATREGGGRIDLPRADNPLIFTDPAGLSFGLLKSGSTSTKTISVADAGGGPAPWNVTVQSQLAPNGATIAPSAPTVTAGSSFTVTLTDAAGGAEGEGAGFVVLTRGTDVRRLPFWYRDESPKLGTEPHGTLTRAGVFHGDTAGKSSLVSTYRYPEGGLGSAIPLDLGGPEQIFRFVLKQPVANFGAVVLSHAAGVEVTPRLVFAGDENHLVGYTGIPVDLNPYSNFGRAQLVVGDVFPAPGAYDVVFDTPTGGKPGKFTFRFWIGDTSPPSVRLLTRSVLHDHAVRLAITDGGSGVDGSSLQARVDGRTRTFSYRKGVLSVGTGRLGRGTHRITVTAADYQETKNMEDVGPILPNTRTFTASFVLR